MWRPGGPKKFGMPLETQGNQTFGRDILRFSPGYPEGARKVEKEKFVFNFWPLFRGKSFPSKIAFPFPQNGLFAHERQSLRKGRFYGSREKFWLSLRGKIYLEPIFWLKRFFWVACGSGCGCRGVGSKWSGVYGLVRKTGAICQIGVFNLETVYFLAQNGLWWPTLTFILSNGSWWPNTTNQHLGAFWFEEVFFECKRFWKAHSQILWWISAPLALRADKGGFCPEVVQDKEGLGQGVEGHAHRKHTHTHRNAHTHTHRNTHTGTQEHTHTGTHTHTHTPTPGHGNVHTTGAPAL